MDFGCFGLRFAFGDAHAHVSIDVRGWFGFYLSFGCVLVALFSQARCWSTCVRSTFFALSVSLVFVSSIVPSVCSFRLVRFRLILTSAFNLSICSSSACITWTVARSLPSAMAVVHLVSFVPDPVWVESGGQPRKRTVLLNDGIRVSLFLSYQRKGKGRCHEEKEERERESIRRSQQGSFFSAAGRRGREERAT